MRLRMRQSSVKRIYAAIAMLLATFPIAVWAADSSVNLPGSIDPSRAGQQLNLPASLPPTKAGISGEPTAPASQPTPGAESIKFQLKQINITGNTVYSYQQLLPLFQHYLGKEISFADLQSITKAITLKYRNAGYILSRAVLPSQVIDKGIVNIRIIEGYIIKSEISQHAGGAEDLLTQYGQALTTKKPLNISDLERYSLLANDIPGMNSAKTILQPPADPNAPAGSTDVVFEPDFSKASGFLSYDNRGTKYLGPNEFSAGGAVNSLLQSGDQFGVQTLASSDWNELRYLNLYTNQPISDTGATFNLSGSYSRTEPAYLLSPLEIEGQSKEVTADVQMPWLRSRKQSFYTTASFDYLNSATDINLFDANFYTDHVRSARLAANYYLQDGWAGANQASLQVSHGLPWLDASDATQPNLSRVTGDPEYTKLNATLSRLQGITENTALYVGTIGQYAYEPLLSSEQFAFGGAQYGQAYDPAEITGDNGVAAKAELRYNTAPGWHYLSNVQYFTFYDIGKIWNIDSEAITGLPQQQSAASTGLGARFNFNQYVYGSAEFAQPLTRQVATNQSFAPRIFVSLTISGRTHTTENDMQFNDGSEQPAGYTNGAATNGPTAQAAASQGN